MDVRTMSGGSLGEVKEQASLRDELDVVIGRLSEGIAVLERRLEPLLAPEGTTIAEATVREVSPWQSTFASQVGELNRLAGLIENIRARLEY